ncbi:FCS-LIKE ZINC FINGER 11 [Salix viminalis]|uniref:FCS-LIKE ZINC FINGER 11 n=2 Tax=Salix viminalis TaxID=40686 RepID=A0A9Q0SDU4_SALVM|nr:FCS-LIKE ZINC FINGER 11 [Salix viminalis]KAJ6674074.1 FCS-LIKE ZINC FINGER 11 [Salix viminalis]
MLRKRTRSVKKDQQTGQMTVSDSGSDSYFQSYNNTGHSHKASSFFTGPGLFVGSSHKGLSDGDSVRSPTSPLDCRMFSNIGNPHKSLRSWDCNKVGLSILDSLDDDDFDGDDGKGFGKALQSSESKNILFGPRVRSKPPNFQSHTDPFQSQKSLPRNFAVFPRTLTKSPLQKGSSDVLFEIGEGPFESEPFGKIRSCSLDSCRSSSSLSRLAGQNLRASSLNFCSDNIPTQVDCPPRLLGGSSNTNNFSNTNLTCTPMSASSGNGFVSSLSASEIELSEDYTCVISHGPNPKTTHIYGGCILECHPNDFSNSGKNEEREIGLAQAATCSKIPTSLPSKDFLSFCYFCNKKLDEGKDIYMYRGEKAFCSSSCRSEEIMIDEEMENTTNKSSEDVPTSENRTGLFETGIIEAP